MDAKIKLLKAFAFLLVIGLILYIFPVCAVMADCTDNDKVTAINLAATKLAAHQNSDGGFAWRLTDPASASSTNVLGITAMGILKAHELNGDSSFEAALANAYAYVVNTPPVYTWNGSQYTESTKGVDSFPDITFLIELAEVVANDDDGSLLNAINAIQEPDILANDIKNLAKSRWDNMILYKGATQESPANGTATTMVQSVRLSRHNAGYDALIPWDLDAAVTAAFALHTYFPFDGYNGQASDISAVIYASIDDGTYFDSDDITQEDYLLGLTGAIEAFSGLHIFPGKTDELAVKLLNLQQADGSWDYYGTTPVTMSVQSTAYAVMALVEEGSENATIAARKGADWLVANQKLDGGWYSEGGSGDEYLEIDSEAALALTRTHAPVITESDPQTVAMSEDRDPTPFSLTLNASDQDGDALTWRISSPASNGVATASGTGVSNSIGYTPDNDFFGTDSFEVQVSDGLKTDTITVNVTISAVNDAPVITEGNATAVVIDLVLNLTLHATDIDGDDLEWSISNKASHGTAWVDGNTGLSNKLGYVPFPGYSGVDIFDVLVKDNHGGEDTIIIYVTINPAEPNILIFIPFQMK